MQMGGRSCSCLGENEKDLRSFDHRSFSSFRIPSKLALFGQDGIGRANGGASATIDAGFSINVVLGLTRGDRVDRAFRFAAAAADAFISNTMSHV